MATLGRAYFVAAVDIATAERKRPWLLRTLNKWQEFALAMERGQIIKASNKALTHKNHRYRSPAVVFGRERSEKVRVRFESNLGIL